jgi:hypothetical protein
MPSRVLNCSCVLRIAGLRLGIYFLAVYQRSYQTIDRRNGEEEVPEEQRFTQKFYPSGLQPHYQWPFQGVQVRFYQSRPFQFGWLSDKLRLKRVVYL